MSYLSNLCRDRNIETYILNGIWIIYIYIFFFFELNFNFYYFDQLRRGVFSTCRLYLMMLN